MPYWLPTSPSEEIVECFMEFHVEKDCFNCIIVVCGISFFWNNRQEVTILDSLDSGIIS